jgi:hypothetical protein
MTLGSIYFFKPRNENTIHNLKKLLKSSSNAQLKLIKNQVATKQKRALTTELNKCLLPENLTNNHRYDGHRCTKSPHSAFYVHIYWCSNRPLKLQLLAPQRLK